MRIFRFLPVFMLIIIISSCTPVVKNTADEIRRNVWSAELKSGECVTLDFKEDDALFKILSKNKKTVLKIKGLCIIDKKKMMIFDSTDKENYVFDYKLKDDKLKLFYDSGELTLVRKIN